MTRAFPLPIAPGARLCGGRFHVLRRLGEGAMGAVYEASDAQRNERVALKLLSRLDAASLYRLKNEFRGLSEVRHPNLVHLHELFGDGERWFFSMELIEGVPWDDWVRPGGVLDEARLRDALRQLCAGVQAIHQAGRLHRDLKPSNVLVGADGGVKVLDFGLSSEPELGGVGLTLQEPWIVGSPGYMAPEQAAGAPSTPASDFYSIGVMLFQALAGQLPFEGSPSAVIEAKQKAAAPAVASHVPEATADLAQLADALLARDPARRPDARAAARACGEPETPAAPRAAPARIAPLLGRDAEQAELRRALALARDGTPAVVRVRGQSGAGKSALLQSFTDDLRGEGRAIVLRGRCFDRESLPYNAFDRVIDDLSRHLRLAPPLEAATLLPRDIHALSRIFPVLQRLEAVQAAPAREVGDEQTLRRRAFVALSELLARLRDRQPLVIAIDDLQWIDQDSLRLFDHLLCEPEPSAILWLLCERAEHDKSRRPWERAADNAPVALLDVELGPLPHTAATELARRLLDGLPGASALARHVAREAGGNPFILGELAYHVSQTGEPMSASLDGALQQRLQGLGEAARLLLERVALCAGPVPESAILAATSTAAGFAAGLDRLRDARLLRASPSGLECYHERIRGAVLASLSPERARDHHLDLARAFAQAGADPEVLLHHHRGAGQREQAGHHALQAARRAVRGLAFDRGAELYGEALELLTAAEADAERVLERHAEALSLAGRWPEAASAFARAEAEAHSPQRRSYLLHQSALHYLASGHPREGLPRLRRVFAQLGVRWPRMRATAWLGALLRLVWLRLRGVRYSLAAGAHPRAFDGLGRTDEAFYPAREGAPADEPLAVELLLASAALVPPYDSVRGLYFATAFCMRALRSGERARVAVALGVLSSLFAAPRLTAGLSQRLARDAQRLARSGDDELSGAALSLVAFGHMLRGGFAQAQSAAAEALARLPREGRSRAYEAWTARTLYGVSLVLLGRLREAEAALAGSPADARALDDDLTVLGARTSLGLLLRDDLEGARALLAQKREALSRVGEHGVLSGVWRVEALCVSLYEGRGDASLLRRGPAPIGLMMPFDLGGLLANCALQAIERGEAPRRHLRRVARTLRQLRNGRTVLDAALAAQLQAALHNQRGDRSAAAANLERALTHFGAAQLRLHEHVARYRLGQLRGDQAMQAAAVAYLRQEGVANPDAWAHAIAPGLG